MTSLDLKTEAAAARMLVEFLADHGFKDEDISISIESECNFVEAVSAAIRRIDELQALSDAAKALAATYTERASRLEDRKAALRDALTEALERSQAPMPLRLAEGTVSLKDTPPSAIVTDEALLPDEFWRTKFTKSVDLRSVTLSLREGVEVPGATLRNSRRTVSVRRA